MTIQKVKMMATRYERPSSAKLAGMKHGLYHPRLPTLRRMSMDTATHKLSTEHSRTTTFCSREDFIKAKSSLSTKREPLHCRVVLDKRTDAAVKSYEPMNATTGDYIETWKKILGMLSTRSSASQTSPELEIRGFAMRCKQPSILSSWQYHPESRSRSRPTTPNPMPATMYSRYRSGSRPHTVNPWK